MTIRKVFFPVLASLLCALTLPAQSDDEQVKRGAVLYQQKCLICHQVSGQGVPPDLSAARGQ